jgi:hypothetical protein
MPLAVWGYPNLDALVMVLVWLAILIVPLRAVFQPLILRYGGTGADDTHGSALTPRRVISWATPAY